MGLSYRNLAVPDYREGTGHSIEKEAHALQSLFLATELGSTVLVATGLKRNGVAESQPVEEWMFPLFKPARVVVVLIGVMVFDVIALSTLTLLVLRGGALLYPWIEYVNLILFAINILVVIFAYPAADVDKRQRVPKLLWFAAAVFTPAGFAAVFVCSSKPDAPHAIGGISAVLLVSYIWFLIYRLRRRSSSTSD